MNRGINHNYIFLTDEHRLYFLELLEKITKNYNVEIHVFCIMGNHYHLVIRTPLGNLNKAMHYLGYNYAKYINKELHRSGPVFQGRYLPVLMDDEKYLLRVARYIHKNPTEANIITDLKDYRWSSYLSYICESKTISWLFHDEVMKRFEKLKYDGDFQNFTKNENDEEVTKFFETLKFQSTLTGEDDIKKIIAYLDESRLPQEYFDNKDIMKLYKPPDINIIIDITAHYFGISKDKICKSSNIKKNNIPRKTAIHLCKHIGKATLRNIGIKMGGVSPTAISNSLSRSANDSNILNHLDKIIAIINKCREYPDDV